jgi:hypothetical protein
MNAATPSKRACVLISTRYGDEAGAWLIAELDRLKEEH